MPKLHLRVARAERVRHALDDTAQLLQATTMSISISSSSSFELDELQPRLYAQCGRVVVAAEPSQNLPVLHSPL